MHRRITIAAVGVAGALALGVSSAGARPPLTTVQCGETLTQSVTLANDLTNCPHAGLIIGADGITVDLNGHTIGGVAGRTDGCGDVADTGGINDAGFDGITIENGVIEGFAAGIAGAFADSRMTGLTLRDAAVGITVGSPNPLADLSNITIEHDVIDGVPCGGAIGLTGGNDDVIEYNRVTNVAGDGLDLLFNDSVQVEHNSFSQLGGAGIALFFNADGNTIDDNVIAGALGGDDSAGLLINGPASDNEIEGNTIERTPRPAILIQSAGYDPGAPADNRVIGNTLASVGDGIVLFEAQGAVVSGNAVTGAGTIATGKIVGFGVLLNGVSDGLVAGNAIFGGLGPAIQVGATPAENPSTIIPTGDVVSGNAVTSRGGDGIDVLAPAQDTTIEGNTANASGADGIDVLSAASTVSGNTASHNANLGIDAVPGVTDGGGNTASANGNPAECVGVVCAPAP